MKLVDAYMLGPAFAKACRGNIPEPTLADRAHILANLETPIHWIRPGGLGDWCILAPFIEGVRKRRRHPEDTLWVTDGAFDMARQYHSASGLRVFRASAPSLMLNPARGLVLQLEPFHPSAWIWAWMLRPSMAWGYPLPDPRILCGPQLVPMILDIEHAHPGVDPIWPSPCAADQRHGVLVFMHGNHPSRRLPSNLVRLLDEAGIQDIVWFGLPPGTYSPPGRVESGLLEARELINLVRSAKAVVSPDAGPFHLARLLGTPAVAYFTSGERSRWGWPTPNSRIVTSSFDCRECTRMALPKPCPFNYGCVQEQDAEQLKDALLDLTEVQTRLDD